MENVQTRKGYEQVCVWPGVVLGDNTPTDFEQWFMEQGFSIQYLETIITQPDIDEVDGTPVPETGGRNDILFAIKKSDIPKFALWRLNAGIRWVEDVLDNEEPGYSIYPERIKHYRTW